MLFYQGIVLFNEGCVSGLERGGLRLESFDSRFKLGDFVFEGCCRCLEAGRRRLVYAGEAANQGRKNRSYLQISHRNSSSFVLKITLV